jgi:hypothetical protein
MAVAQRRPQARPPKVFPGRAPNTSRVRGHSPLGLSPVAAQPRPVDARMQSLLALRLLYRFLLHPLAVPTRRRGSWLRRETPTGGRGCAGPQRRGPLPLQRFACSAARPPNEAVRRTDRRSVFPAGRTRQDGRNTPTAASRGEPADPLAALPASEVTRRLYSDRCKLAVVSCTLPAAALCAICERFRGHLRTDCLQFRRARREDRGASFPSPR